MTFRDAGPSPARDRRGRTPSGVRFAVNCKGGAGYFISSAPSAAQSYRSARRTAPNVSRRGKQQEKSSRLTTAKRWMPRRKPFTTRASGGDSAKAYSHETTICVLTARRTVACQWLRMCITSSALSRIGISDSIHQTAYHCARRATTRQTERVCLCPTGV